MNPNWVRWAAASLNKHFVTEVMDRGGLFTYVLEQDVDREQQRDYAEIRFDGPHAYPYQAGKTRLEVNINVRVLTKLDYQDLYQRHRNVGLVMAAFASGICVYQYGDDASAFVGTLQLTNKSVIVTNFGQIVTTVPALQTTVEGHYKMYLDN